MNSNPCINAYHNMTLATVNSGNHADIVWVQIQTDQAKMKLGKCSMEHNDVSISHGRVPMKKRRKEVKVCQTLSKMFYDSYLSSVERVNVSDLRRLLIKTLSLSFHTSHTNSNCHFDQR